MDRMMNVLGTRLEALAGAGAFPQLSAHSGAEARFLGKAERQAYFPKKMTKFQQLGTDNYEE